MLTQFVLTNAKPRANPHSLSDGAGLHLYVQPNGAKLWRFRYRFNGKANMLSFGAFPTVTLLEARSKRDDAKRLLSQNIDPSEKRKAEKTAAVVASGNTFGAIATEYLAKIEAESAAPATMAKNRWLLNDLAAPLYSRPITAITPREVLDLLRKIEKTGRRESAHRLKGTIGSVFRFAIVTDRGETDPTASLKGALLRVQVQHRAALTEEGQVGALWASINEYDGWPTLKAALQFAMLTMSRPIEVRQMKKPQVNFGKAVWNVPAGVMKQRLPHEVPLSRQAVAVLEGMWDLTKSELVFPSIRSHQRPLSENALNSALRRMGYTKEEQTAHGFRTCASTILNERGDFDAEAIELSLAHQDEDEVRRIYNRAKYWKQRVALMQAWADILDELRQPSRIAA